MNAETTAALDTPTGATSASTGTTRVAIVGASGYTGAELLRLIAGHPHLELVAATSGTATGKRLDKVHPHLRGATADIAGLKCVAHDAVGDLDADVAFLAVPHGRAMGIAPGFVERGTQVVDLSADFRLRDPAAYPHWYGHEHTAPELLAASAYGIAEHHRDAYAGAPLVSGAGCIATTAILSLAPLVKAGWVDPARIVVDAKIGSSAGGVAPGAGSHHPDRQRAVRPYAAAGHRHTAEIEQELATPDGSPRVALSAHAVEMVRGIFATGHVFLDDDHRDVTEKDLWKLYRAAYNDEPFVRIVKERQGVHRVPDPRLLVGTNVCEVGFELDPHTGRVVVFGALDNLTKGAAGAAVQNVNIIRGYAETTGLATVGLYPFA